MNETKSNVAGGLGLRAGDVVEVRSAEEIFRTLDSKGCLESLPFMPEMLKFCNKRFTVYKRAHKTCDTILKTGGRSLENVVHLSGVGEIDGVRCDGSGHGKCEASCLIFWNEAWLRRIPPQQVAITEQPAEPKIAAEFESVLQQAAVAPGDGKPVYRCQATQLNAYTRKLPWWHMGQYVQDLTSGNASLLDMARAVIFAGYRGLVRFGVGYTLLLKAYNWFQSKTGGTPWPYIQGALPSTPRGEILGLRPGDLVRVKPVEEIVATLDSRNRNRGLLFAPEMVRFCGGTYRVLKRVNNIVDEKNGEMLEFSNPCIILQSVFCRSEFSEQRVFCPRAIYPYWREIWLDRVAQASVQAR